MDFINDEFKIYRGDNYYLSDEVYVRQPSIDEICSMGEEDYLRMVYRLTSVPQNSIYILHDMGIDFTKISDFELFIIIHNTLEYDKTKFLIPNLNFETAHPTMVNKVTSKGTVLETQEMALSFDNGIILKEKTYLNMMSFIRKINRIQRPWFKTVGNESTKKRMIKSAINEYETQKDNPIPFDSVFIPLVSSLSLTGINENEIWNMKLYKFFDLVFRLQLKEQSEHLFTGIYSGCIDFNKVKGNLDWMKKVEFNEYSGKIDMVVEA